MMLVPALMMKYLVQYFNLVGWLYWLAVLSSCYERCLYCGLEVSKIRDVMLFPNCGS